MFEIQLWTSGKALGLLNTKLSLQSNYLIFNIKNYKYFIVDFIYLGKHCMYTSQSSNLSKKKNLSEK